MPGLGLLPVDRITSPFQPASSTNPVVNGPQVILVSTRQRSVTLSDEAFRASEELSIIEQTDMGDFVSTLIVNRSRYSRAPSEEGEIGEVSGLLSSILADAQSIVPREVKVRGRTARDSRQRRRRFLAR
jgi:hypothetical protein